MFNRDAILQQAKNHDSFYLYDESKIIEAARRLKQNFENVHFLYSMKTNPNKAVLKCVLDQGLGVDAASAAEVKLGKQNGIVQEKIQYSAPGKKVKDIEETINDATIIADSLNEILLINEIAEKKDLVADIGIRVNPSFSFFGGSASPSKFGVDEQQLFDAVPSLLKLKNVSIKGLHVHLRSQELNAAVIEKYYENLLELAVRFQAASGQALSFFNMGSGIGIPYSPDDVPLDVARLGAEASKLFESFRLKLPSMQVYIETGRYVVGKSGVYVTKVLDKKVSCGKTFVILNNTLNGFVRPSIAMLVANYSKDEHPAASEPLFTSKDAFQFFALNNETETEIVTLVGNLCTAADIMAADLKLPKLNCGDIVVITNAGSYAAVLSPMQFSSQDAPVELFLRQDGEIINTTH